jgi:penicillin amidase
MLSTWVSLTALGVAQTGLPLKEGTIAVKGLNAQVRMDRDAKGIVTIAGTSAADVLRGIGFAHAQDRYFQMDALRRFSAGEVSEVAGAFMLESDKSLRVLGLRAIARKSVEALSAPNRALLDAYVEGVNAGYASLPSPPPEYTLLGVTPAPWTAEDSALVMFTFACQLQGGAEGWKEERALGIMLETLDPAVYTFATSSLHPKDVPLFGPRNPGVMDLPPLPTPEQFTTRAMKPADALNSERIITMGPAEQEECFAGSNNFAVDSTRSKDGRAIVCGDPHLMLQAPNIWYRARLELAGAREVSSMTGVTAPGVPAVIMGAWSVVPSDGSAPSPARQFAWTMTNVQADLMDTVIIEEVQPGKTYVTPAGETPYTVRQETVKVKGTPGVDIEVLETIWGPVVGKNHTGKPLAMKWMAMEPGTFVFETLTALESPPRTMEEMLHYLVNAIDPAQNCVVGDGSGKIGYVLSGAYPLRRGFDGSIPTAWSDGSRGWEGEAWPRELGEMKRPRFTTAPQSLGGVVVTANNRVWDVERTTQIGFGGDNPWRASRADEILRSRTDWDEASLQKVALDTRVERFEIYRDIILTTGVQDTRFSAAHTLAKEWNGTADADQVGYRLVRRYSQRVRDAINTALLAPAIEKARAAGLTLEYVIGDNSARRIIQERPLHLLPRVTPDITTWEKFFEHMLELTLADLAASKAGMEAAWGKVNTSAINHPIGGAIPGPLGARFNFPPHAQSGDGSALRVASATFGASTRFVVSPLHLSDGFMHMPGGQSGNPASEHYKDMHAAWIKGEATPFMPGERRFTLVLEPGA